MTLLNPRQIPPWDNKVPSTLLDTSTNNVYSKTSMASSPVNYPLSLPLHTASDVMVDKPCLHTFNFHSTINSLLNDVNDMGFPFFTSFYLPFVCSTSFGAMNTHTDVFDIYITHTDLSDIFIYTSRHVGCINSVDCTLSTDQKGSIIPVLNPYKTLFIPCASFSQNMVLRPMFS